MIEHYGTYGKPVQVSRFPLQDCLGLILDLLDPVTVAILEKVNRGLYSMIQVNTTNG